MEEIKIYINRFWENNQCSDVPHISTELFTKASPRLPRLDIIPVTFLVIKLKDIYKRTIVLLINWSMILLLIYFSNTIQYNQHLSWVYHIGYNVHTDGRYHGDIQIHLDCLSRPRIPRDDRSLVTTVVVVVSSSTSRVCGQTRHTRNTPRPESILQDVIRKSVIF